jgi:site-specific recombinase XerD
MKSPFQLDAWIEGYLAYLREVRRRSPGTVKDVRCTVKRTCQGLGALRPGVALWELELVDYLQWIERERSEGRSPACLQKYVSHLRGLLDYAWRSGRSQRNVLDGFSLQDAKRRRPPRVLTIEEAERLVAGCPESSAGQRRDRLMVLVLYGCGLRTSELCALRVQDVDRERKELFIRHGKGDRERVVPIPEGVYTPMLAYLLERGGKQGPLFRTAARRRGVSSAEVSRVVREAADRAARRRDHATHAPAFVCHASDGPGRRSRGDRFAAGPPRPTRDRRLPACAPGATS